MVAAIVQFLYLVEYFADTRNAAACFAALLRLF
jgi:hypothetical protein